MTLMHLFSLLFVGIPAVGAYGQECSGGHVGGMDATGNQCSSPALDGHESGIVALAQSPPSAIGARTTGEGRLRTSRVAAPRNAPVLLATAKSPGWRFPGKVVPSGVRSHTAKITDLHETSCSGGADGGMDATGNQCALSTPPLTDMEHRDAR